MKRPVLSNSELISITKRIQQQTNKTLSSEHTMNMRNQKSSRNAAITKRICPNYSGQLANRTGSYGNFLGCSNYPKCRFNNKL